MDGNGYCRPASPRPGGIYYLRGRDASGASCYRQVVLLGYRPHPAELLVRDGTRARVIYRGDLFCRSGGTGELAQ